MTTLYEAFFVVRIALRDSGRGLGYVRVLGDVANARYKRQFVPFEFILSEVLCSGAKCYSSFDVVAVMGPSTGYKMTSFKGRF